MSTLPDILGQWRAKSLSVSGTQNDYLLDPAFDVFLITAQAGGAAESFSGFTGWHPGVARVVAIWNVASVSFQILHQSASSAAANRVIIAGAANQTVTEGQLALLIYDPLASRWRYHP